LLDVAQRACVSLENRHNFEIELRGGARQESDGTLGCLAEL
jgi:hypothetical protein